MKYELRRYPEFSACGLNCGLCPRYHTDGSSRCPGCAGEGFSKVHPSCGMLSCCQRKGLAYCFLCEEYPCRKYDGVDLSDSFISHKNQFSDSERAKQIGLEAYEIQLNEKITILKKLLQNYDDGRKKSFYCLAVNLLDLHDSNAVMDRIATEVEPEASRKAMAAIAARLFEEMAAKKGVSLKLRR